MDPREKVLRDYFKQLTLTPSSSSKVERVNLFPNADFLFLDMDRVIQLGELNKKYRDYYLSVDEFVSRLLEGKFSVGSGMSLKLKDLNDRVERFIEELDAKSKMEQDMIDEDVNNLKDMFVARIEEYFETLKDKLKNMYYEQNSELKENLIEARKTLKDELLQVINNADFFDKNKFFVEFDALKKHPTDLEKFLKDYLNNEKTIQFNKDLDDNIRKLSPVFNSHFNLEDKLVKYVLNIEKLDPKGGHEGEEAEMVLEKFIDTTILHIDSTMKRVRHFSRDEDVVAHHHIHQHEDGNYGSNVSQIGGKSPTKLMSKTDGHKSPALGTSKIVSKTAGKERSMKKGSEIPLIRFKNAQDLTYDYAKFADCSITQASLELHGNNLNQKSADYMGRFLCSVARIEKLNINLSISSVTREYVEPIVQGIKRLPMLKQVDIDLSRSKIETEAFELLADAIGTVESLRSVGISVEKYILNYVV